MKPRHSSGGIDGAYSWSWSGSRAQERSNGGRWGSRPTAAFAGIVMEQEATAIRTASVTNRSRRARFAICAPREPTGMLFPPLDVHWTTQRAQPTLGLRHQATRIRGFSRGKGLSPASILGPLHFGLARGRGGGCEVDRGRGLALAAGGDDSACRPSRLPAILPGRHVRSCGWEAENDGFREEYGCTSQDENDGLREGAGCTGQAPPTHTATKSLCGVP